MQNLKHFWLISWRKKANGNVSTSYQCNSKKKFRLKGSMCPERSKIWEKHYTYMVARQWVFLTQATFSLHAHLSTKIQHKPYIGFYYQSLYVFYNSCRCDLSNKINYLYVYLLHYGDFYNFFDFRHFFHISKLDRAISSFIYWKVRRDTTINFDGVFGHYTNTVTP